MATPTTLPATFTSGQVLTAAQMNNLRGAFRVLQVVSTTKTDTFSVTSSTFTDITGLTAVITPSATSSKILVVATTMVAGESGATNAYVRIARGGTGIAIGDTAGSRISATAIGLATNLPYSIAVSTLDSPNTTSSTTYSIQVRNQGSGAIHVNRPTTDVDAVVNGGRFSSTITVMEISA